MLDSGKDQRDGDVVEELLIEYGKFFDYVHQIHAFQGDVLE